MQRCWEKSVKVISLKNVDQGRSTILVREVMDDLLFFLSQRPIAYLDEMR